MTARQRERQRLKMRRYYARVRQTGRTPCQIFASAQVIDKIKSLQKQFGVTRRSVVEAALIVGLRSLRPSELMNVDRLYHAHFKLYQETLFKKGCRSRPKDQHTGQFTVNEPSQMSA